MLPPFIDDQKKKKKICVGIKIIFCVRIFDPIPMQFLKAV